MRDFLDTTYTTNILTSLLWNLSFKLNDNNQIGFKNLYSIPDSFACILQFLNKSDTTKVGIFFKKVKEWSIVRKEIYGTKLTHNDVKNITKQLCSKYKDDVDIFDYDTAFKFLKNYCTQLYKARQKCLDEENQPKNYLTLHKELMIVRKYKNYAKCQPQKYEIIYEDKMLMTKYQTIYIKY